MNFCPGFFFWDYQLWTVWVCFAVASTNSETLTALNIVPESYFFVTNFWSLTVLLWQLVQLQFQQFVNEFCWLSVFVKDFYCSFKLSVYLSAERAGAVLCAEKSLLYLCVCSVYLSFLTVNSQANICTITVAVHFFSALFVMYNLALLLSSFPLLISSSILLFSVLFKGPLPPTPVNRLFKN